MTIPLTSLKVGDKATIQSLNGGRVFQKRLRTMGIREDKVIELVTKHPMSGPLVVKVEGRNTTIGRGMANRIIVRRE
ncbi:MAG: FeoA family protein [Thermoplasmatota archaeon]